MNKAKEPRLNLEEWREWAIERALTFIADRAVERHIARAKDDNQAILAARARLEMGGGGGPGIPWYAFTKKGVLISNNVELPYLKTKDDSLLVPYQEIIARVRGRQLVLF